MLQLFWQKSEDSRGCANECRYIRSRWILYISITETTYVAKNPVAFKHLVMLHRVVAIYTIKRGL